VKIITISSKSGCPQDAWTPIWLKAWLKGRTEKDLAIARKAKMELNMSE